jgi:hypothetical protein
VTRLLHYIRHHAVKQSAPGLCGPTALRNALLCYERFPVPSGSTRGCDERRLNRIALRHGYRLDYFACRTPGFARSQIRWWARRGIPTLLCVDRDSEGYWAHWIACVSATARHAYICDSSTNAPRDPQRLPWSQFLARAVTVTHVSESGFNTRYDLYGVTSI